MPFGCAPLVGRTKWVNYKTQTLAPNDCYLFIELDSANNMAPVNEQAKSAAQAPLGAPSAAASASHLQQQELVKLLAQHFHQQFYQLAANGPSNSNLIQAPATTNSHPFQSALYNYAAAGGRPQAPTATTSGNGGTGGYPAEMNPLLLAAFSSGSFDFSGLNGFVGGGAELNPAIFPHQHPLKSQFTSTTNDRDTSTSETLDYSLSHNSNHTTTTNPADLGTKSPAVAAAAAADCLSHYQTLNELSMIGALGLNNLTSNQLVFSLHQQQQSLLKAAAAAHAQQYELRNRSAISAEQHHQQQHQHQQQQQQQQQLFHAHPQLANQSEAHKSDHKREPTSHHIEHERKEILKFGINTILGAVSPHHQVTGGANDAHAKRSAGRSNSRPALRRDPEAAVKACQRQLSAETALNHQSFRSSDEHQEVDCDQLESASESGSTNTSSPAPASHTSSSLLSFNSSDPTTVSNLASTGHHHGHPLSLAHHSIDASHPSLPFIAAAANSTAFPWTGTARGKPRRGMMRRAVFSDSQRVGLEKRFQLQKYISKPDRKKLAEKLGLRDSQVKIWFQNRRMKWRNSKERELLSTGGSREQTLPTRNNPNPDLSDVGETIKRLAVTSGIASDS